MKAPPFMKTHKLAKKIIFSKKEGNKIIKQKLQLLRTERHEFPDKNILFCALLWMKKKFYE